MGGAGRLAWHGGERYSEEIVRRRRKKRLHNLGF